MKYAENFLRQSEGVLSRVHLHPHWVFTRLSIYCYVKYLLAWLLDGVVLLLSRTRNVVHEYWVWNILGLNCGYLSCMCWLWIAYNFYKSLAILFLRIWYASSLLFCSYMWEAAPDRRWAASMRLLQSLKSVDLDTLELRLYKRKLSCIILTEHVWCQFILFLLFLGSSYCFTTMASIRSSFFLFFFARNIELYSIKTGSSAINHQARH